MVAYRFEQQNVSIAPANAHRRKATHGAQVVPDGCHPASSSGQRAEDEDIGRRTAPQQPATRARSMNDGKGPVAVPAQQSTK